MKQMVSCDLELDILVATMAGGDVFIREVVRNVLLTGTCDPGTICYRQDILRDCMNNPDSIQEMYDTASASIEEYLKIVGRYTGQSADAVRINSVKAIELFIEMLATLRGIGKRHGEAFVSEGFRTFFSMLDREFSDEYLLSMREMIEELKLPEGHLIRAVLGKGNQGTGYAIQRSRKPGKQSWISRFISREDPDQYHFTIAERDVAGFRALGELKGESVRDIAALLVRVSDHLVQMCTSLKTELAFYLGCIQLHSHLSHRGTTICFPVPEEPGSRKCSVRGVYDICLALRIDQPIVSNDLFATGKDLTIITGANRGGKTTFLRSIGLAQMMMQAGMFVPAESFHAEVCTGIFTHFRREEDHSMQSGKFDEELRRMSQIVDSLKPDSMVLFNESFAATNEREGSEVSHQIVSALIEKQIRVLFVTHLHEFSRSLYDQSPDNALFLRAERMQDGERTFRIEEGKPLQTSFGPDLYTRIFSETHADTDAG
ncbi:DNA mismatch repair ATPase MutS [Methanocalculus sp. AMF5]|nr:DNA mismatch repair ATPase MutS [Methanocalculus sp. AMF5]